MKRLERFLCVCALALVFVLLGGCVSPPHEGARAPSLDDEKNPQVRESGEIPSWAMERLNQDLQWILLRRKKEKETDQ